MKRVLAAALLLLPASLPLARGQSPQTLDFFVGQALANSPLLSDLRNQAALNRQDSLLLRATYRPQLSANAGFYFAPATATQNGWGYDPAITNIGTFSPVLSATRTIIRQSDLRTQLAATPIQNAALDNTARLSAQDLRRTVTAQYLGAYGDARQLLFDRELLQRLQEESAILKVLTEANTYRQTDFLAFLTAVQQQEMAVRQIGVQYQNDLALLRFTCGIADTSDALLAPPALSVEPALSFAETAFGRQFDLQRLLYQNQDSLADIPYHPRLELMADVGMNTSFVNDFYKHFGLSVGATVSVPIYDGGQRRLQHDKIAIGQQTNAAYRDFAARQYEQQLLQLYQQLDGAARLLAFQQEQLPYAESLLDANRRLLRTGDARIADYLLAINNYLTIKNTANQLEINRLLLINQINYFNLK